MIRAIIFDLDNCLSAADEVGSALFEPAFQAIRRANRASVSERTLAEAFNDCWRHSLDFVAVRHGFSRVMLMAGWEAMAQTEVQEPMHGYPDLAILAELPVQRFLVTSGFRRLQESKVKALGIAPRFTEVHIDAIDDPGRQGKQQLFQSILTRHRFKTEEVFVVGDNEHSEIEAGNRLGIRTVQILRPGVTRSSSAVHHIRTLSELKGLVADSGA